MDYVKEVEMLYEMDRSAEYVADNYSRHEITCMEFEVFTGSTSLKRSYLYFLYECKRLRDLREPDCVQEIKFRNMFG